MKQKKQTGLIGLYSGREIKASATKQSALTRTQTGKQALSAITAKYGQVVDNAKYFHKGKGEWHKYSLENDKKRTGSVTSDITAWRQRPNKLDFQGIDTKPEGSGTKRKAKTITQKVKPAMQKRALPISSLKNSNKLSGRSGKTVIKAVSEPALKTVEKPKSKVGNLKKALQNMKPGEIKEIKVKYPVGTVLRKEEYGYVHQYKVTGIQTTNQYRKEPGPYYNIVEIPSSDKDKWTHRATSLWNERDMETLKIISKPENKGIQIPLIKNKTGIKARKPVKKAKAPKTTPKREPGTFEHYGKNLLKGEYKDEFANLRSGITKVLKEKYPNQLFVIVARGFYNRSADVYWTGGPSEKEVRKLGLGLSKSYFRESDIERDVYWHRETPEKLRKLINGVEHNKALKTKAKVSYTRKLKPSDLEAPKPVVKLPAKIPTKTPAAVPKKTIKGRKVKSQMQLKHTPVLKTGRPKPKVYKGFLVTGDTYPLKNTIKAMGGKWNGDLKGWVVPPGSAKEINKLKKEKRLSVTSLKTEEDVYRRISAAERLDLRKEKYEKKAERWENSAARKSKKAAALRESSQKLIEDIPFGQPMLIGHHSYNADKNRREKSWNQFGKSIHMQDEADETKRKARVISHVADRLGSTADLHGRIAKTEKELNHARNKVTKAEENKRWAISRKDSSEADRYDAEAKYWAKRTEAIQADLDSFKARLPASALEKPSYGVTMTMLSGAKLKPLVGASSITKRHHNKNLKGGNFAIEVRKGNSGVELQGYHNTDGIIYNLRVGPLFGVGATVINQENYKEFKLEQLVTVVKRALGV